MRDWQSDYKNEYRFEGGYIGEDAPSYQAAMGRILALKAQGYDLFRGQSVPHKLDPTIYRKSVDVEEARARLANFTKWVHTKPDLQRLHGNFDAIIAVAQHYGLPTALLDFTTNPEVAGFFAQSESMAHAISAERPSCIACIKSSLLSNSWAMLNGIAALEDRNADFRLIQVPTKGFRRIAAQSGVFIWTTFDSGSLEVWTDIWRVFFPPVFRESKLTEADLFPKRLSSEEKLLADYFMHDEGL